MGTVYRWRKLTMTVGKPALTNEKHSQHQGNIDDCGIYMMENARRISRGEAVDQVPIDADKLRVEFAGLILRRSRYETSEKMIRSNLLYPEATRSWQVGTKRRSYSDIDTTKARRRKLQFEELQAQDASPEDFNSDHDEPSAQTADAEASLLFKASPFRPWRKYFDGFAECSLQKTAVKLGPDRAFRLLQMVMAIGSPRAFCGFESGNCPTPFAEP